MRTQTKSAFDYLIDANAYLNEVAREIGNLPEENSSVRFFLSCSGNKIVSVDYQRDFCPTVMAVSEFIRQTCRGIRKNQANLKISADYVYTSLPGLNPHSRQKIQRLLDDFKQNLNFKQTINTEKL